MNFVYTPSENEGPPPEDVFDTFPLLQISDTLVTLSIQNKATDQTACQYTVRRHTEAPI